jgi:hypothetical protein
MESKKLKSSEFFSVVLFLQKLCCKTLIEIYESKELGIEFKTPNDRVTRADIIS